MRMLFGIEHALARADRAAGRHDARGAGFLEPPGDDRVVGRVAQHLKAVGHELLGRFERGDGSGSSVVLSASTSSFTQSAPGFSRPSRISRPKPGDADRIVGGEAAGRVGQQRVAAGVDEIEQVVAGRVDQPLAADGDGDALGAAALERFAHQLVVGVLAGADDQPAGEAMRAELQDFGGCFCC